MLSLITKTQVHRQINTFEAAIKKERLKTASKFVQQLCVYITLSVTNVQPSGPAAKPCSAQQGLESALGKQQHFQKTAQRIYDRIRASLNE